MSWTKFDLVKKAFSKIGLSSYVYDLDPDQLQDVAQDLEAMMAEWNVKFRLGYPIAATPGDIDLNDDSGLPDAVLSAVYLNLAVRIADDFGKVISANLSKSAKAAYDALTIKSVMPIERQFPKNTPAGAGNKPASTYRVFLPQPSDPVDAGNDGALIYE
jgi:P22 tail accessory factor